MTSRATRKARREVLEGKKDRTKGGLTSDDIVLNKGRPVSKKQHEKHKRAYEEEANHPLKLWQHALSTVKARPEHAHLLSGKFVKAKKYDGGKVKHEHKLYTQVRKEYERLRETPHKTKPHPHRFEPHLYTRRPSMKKTQDEEEAAEVSDPGFEHALALSSRLDRLEQQLKTARKSHIHALDGLLEYERVWDELNALHAGNTWPGIRDNDQKETMEMLWQDHNGRRSYTSTRTDYVKSRGGSARAQTANGFPLTRASFIARGSGRNSWRIIFRYAHMASGLT